MVERFPIERIPAEVRAIAERLSRAGHEVWFVGGAVRDVLIELILGREPTRAGDFDIATAARPEEVRRLFRRTVPVGIEHGTVAVLDERGGVHEVTTFRRDVKTDGRHAEVEFGVSLDDDLARRDFTINAVAVHPDSGEVRDPFAGQEDIAARKVRAVGEAARRFAEDRLRVLRALRFAAALEFAVDQGTWEAILASAGELKDLSRERVRDEWVKMLETSRPSVGVGLWRGARVMEEVWPELKRLSAANRARLDAVTPKDPVLVTAAALSYAGKGPAAAAEAARRLRFSNHQIERVRLVVAALGEPLPEAGDAPAVRRWLSLHNQVAADALSALGHKGKGPALTAAVNRIREAGDPLSVHELAVTGTDLMTAGVPEGPRVGEMLRRLLEEVLDEPAKNTKEVLLARAREMA